MVRRGIETDLIAPELYPISNLKQIVIKHGLLWKHVNIKIYTPCCFIGSQVRYAIFWLNIKPFLLCF